jgi:hypothetical protein
MDGQQRWMAASPVQTATGEVAASQGGAGQPGTGTVSEQTAAQSLSRLLTQSISDRSAILSAYHDVDTCGSGLVADARTFQQAATSRCPLRGDERVEPRGHHGQDHVRQPLEPDRGQVRAAHLPAG